MASRMAGVNAAVAALAGVILALAKLLPHNPAQASVTPRLDTDAVVPPVASFKRASTIASVYPARVSGRFKNGIFILTPPCNHGHGRGSRRRCYGVSASGRNRDYVVVGCVDGEPPAHVATKPNDKRRKRD